MAVKFALSAGWPPSTPPVTGYSQSISIPSKIPGAEMPSVLIECGFLSNPRETQWLIQPSYQAALADGIAAAIVHYFNPDAAVGNL